MKKKLILPFFTFVFSCFFLLAQNENIPVTIDADQISFTQEKLIAEGNVVMEHKEVKIFCDKAIYDTESNKAEIIGEARIVRGESVAYGDNIFYDFNTLEAHVDKLRISQPPIYGQAGHIEESQEKYTLKKGFVTTCDLDEPHYGLFAKRVTVYPQERIVARGMTLKIGKLPVFYFPYFSHNLNDDAFPLEISPGRASQWGYYLLNRWRYNFSQKNRGRIIFDWYEKRGQGMGIDHQLKGENYGDALFRYYRISDELSKIEKEKAFFDQYPYRESKDRQRNRYKGQFFHSWQPTDQFSLTSELHKFSDRYFMKDFFRQEYDIDPAPKSYLLATYSLDNSSLSLLAQKRVNRFFAQTEYLPQLEYNFYPQKLGKSNFYFDSLGKVGNLRETEANSGQTDDALRVYWENILSYRARLGWLNFIPYGGAHNAYYSRGDLKEKNIFRTVPKVGATLNTTLYKTFAGPGNFLGERIDQFRHVFTPEVAYSNVGRPTKLNEEIFQFDDYDNLERKQNIIFKLKNKLQAKNEERTWDFLYFSPSLEYRLSQEGKKGGRFDNVTADLEIYPVKNISFNSDAKYDFNQNYFSQVNAGLTFKSRAKVEIDQQLQVEQRPRYTVSLGHRYTRGDSSLGTLGITYNLTPKLKLRNYLRYEYTTGDLEKQQYALRFDLHCWWMDIGLDLDRQERGGKDTTVWIAFKLKAFPDINMDFSQTFDGAKSAY